MYIKSLPASYLSAPQIADKTSVLAALKIWLNNDSITDIDQYSFLTIPSQDRDAFLLTLTESMTVISPVFATLDYVV